MLVLDEHDRILFQHHFPKGRKLWSTLLSFKSSVLLVWDHDIECCQHVCSVLVLADGTQHMMKLHEQPAQYFGTKACARSNLTASAGLPQRRICARDLMIHSFSAQ